MVYNSLKMFFRHLECIGMLWAFGNSKIIYILLHSIGDLFHLSVEKDLKLNGFSDFQYQLYLD